MPEVAAVRDLVSSGLDGEPLENPDRPRVLVEMEEMRNSLDGGTHGPDNDYGDATVPLTGGIGLDQPMDANTVRRIPDQHGNLQRNQQAFDEIEGILTAKAIRRRATKTVTLRVGVPDLALTTEGVHVTADVDALTTQGTEDDGRHGVVIKVVSESGAILGARQPRLGARHAEAHFKDFPPGAYSVVVEGTNPASPVIPVTATTVLWDPASLPG